MFTSAWVPLKHIETETRNFADDTLKHIFWSENVRISITIWLKFVPKGPINNIPALVYDKAWRRPGNKPLFELIKVSLRTHICVTRPKRVNDKSALVKVRLHAEFSTNPYLH